MSIESKSQFFNEVVGVSSEVRPLYQAFFCNMSQLDFKSLNKRMALVKRELVEHGVSFLKKQGASSYFLEMGKQEPIPFDPIPRILTNSRWSKVQQGVRQRASVFNLFIKDVYSGRQNIVPWEIVKSSKFYYQDHEGLHVPDNIYLTLYGADVVAVDDTFAVLEDNTGTPAGAVYAMVARQLMLQFFLDLMGDVKLKPLGEMSRKLREIHLDLCRDVDDPLMVYLTRGPGGADFYESMYLSQQAGFVLADPEDIWLEADGSVYLKMLNGKLHQVDLIYSRLSPFFRLVHELPKTLHYNRVRVVNLPGGLLFSDKAIFAYVPDIIRHYLGEEPILTQPETLLMNDAKVHEHVFGHIEEFVIKTRSGLGGKQVLIGSNAGKEEIEQWRLLVKETPINYVAQRYMAFSRHVRLSASKDRFLETAVDLRVFALMGREKVEVVTDVLSRCDDGSSGKVNISSGGAMKDTWLMNKEG